VDDVLVLRVARPSDVLLAALKGWPTECKHGTNRRHRYFEGAGAMRVMIFMLTASRPSR